MVKAVYDDLARPEPRRHFTVGINDDVTHLSLPYDPSWSIEPDDVVRALFFGLGADGTVGANKNSIKIIGEDTPNYAQGYFFYDSKKSGTLTISHLRFGPRPIRSSYLVDRASFVACHQLMFLDKYEMLEQAAPGATFLLNAPYPADQVWDKLPREVQQQIVDKKLRFFVIDAYKVARDNGMGVRINTVMQTCFFAISGVLPRDQAIAHIKKAIEKTYGRKGPEVVRKNFEAVDATLAHLHEVKVPGTITGQPRTPVVPDAAPDFVKKVTALMLANQGDLLPVSAFPVDGTWPTGTTRWEKRAIALEIPVWETGPCIQCNKCSVICPHSAIRTKYYGAEKLAGAPATFKSMDYKSAEVKGARYSVQVAPEDCTGCGLCVQICPGVSKKEPEKRALAMQPVEALRAPEARNWDFFLGLPLADRTQVKLDVKGTQFLEPLFEFSGACTGCGETPYIRLLTQLVGDRLMVANATGCTSIFGGNLPTTPYCKNADGRGPAWSNSLFEDNAEFGYGMRLAVDKQAEFARELLAKLAPKVGDALVKGLLSADQSTEAGIAAQRERVKALRAKLAGTPGPEAARLADLADQLVKKSIWIVGGDGWAYDIGYGGLDHVLAMGRDVNILVLDTEVYSNTGGQASKSTPMAASAKFAAAGKPTAKKDLAMLAMTYGNVYVAKVALGAKDAQTVRALQEAESYPGTSIVIAYAHCLQQGIGAEIGLEQQELAVDSGHWPLFRFDPRRAAAGESPLKLDSPAPKVELKTYAEHETRYRAVKAANAERYEKLIAEAQKQVRERYALYELFAKGTTPPKA